MAWIKPSKKDMAVSFSYSTPTRYLGWMMIMSQALVAYL